MHHTLQRVFELCFAEIMYGIQDGSYPDIFGTLPSNSRWDKLFSKLREQRDQGLR